MWSPLFSPLWDRVTKLDVAMEIRELSTPSNTKIRLLGHDLKPSRYVYHIIDGASHFLYNLRTGALLPFNSPNLVHEHLMYINYGDDFDNDLLARLITGGFVYYADSEIDLLQKEYMSHLISNKWFTTKIVTTLRCNFSCPYCFEMRKTTKLKPSVQNKLINFVEKGLKNCRGLSVAWFGGEPLLCMHLLRDLTPKLVNLCNWTGKQYIASLTTNGYLIEHVVDELDDLHIRYVQVTFDGFGSEHDRTRKLKSGHGTFTKLHKNVEMFCKRCDNAVLLLRVNCTSENISSVPKLLTSFSELVKQRTIVFFRWVWGNQQCGYADFSGGRSENSMWQELAELYKAAIVLGFRVQNPLRMYPIYCEVDNFYFVQVAPDEALHLCSESYSEKAAIGDLNSSPYLNTSSPWYALTPFKDTICRQCSLLPVCFGGCRMSRSRGRRKCVIEKHDVLRFIEIEVMQALKSTAVNVQNRYKQ